MRTASPQFAGLYQTNFIRTDGKSSLRPKVINAAFDEFVRDDAGNRWLAGEIPFNVKSLSAVIADDRAVILTVDDNGHDAKTLRDRFVRTEQPGLLKTLGLNEEQISNFDGSFENPRHEKEYRNAWADFILAVINKRSKPPIELDVEYEDAGQGVRFNRVSVRDAETEPDKIPAFSGRIQG